MIYNSTKKNTGKKISRAIFEKCISFGLRNDIFGLTVFNELQPEDNNYALEKGIPKKYLYNNNLVCQVTLLDSTKTRDRFKIQDMWEALVK